MQSNRCREIKSPASGMQQAPPADFKNRIAGSSDVDWDGGWGRCRCRGRCRGSQGSRELCHAVPAAEALDAVGHGVAQDGGHLQRTQQLSRHDSPTFFDIVG